MLFGGFNAEQGRMNDVYIIDLQAMVMTVFWSTHTYMYIEHLYIYTVSIILDGASYTVMTTSS